MCTTVAILVDNPLEPLICELTRTFLATKRSGGVNWKYRNAVMKYLDAEQAERGKPMRTKTTMQ